MGFGAGSLFGCGQKRWMDFRCQSGAVAGSYISVFPRLLYFYLAKIVTPSFSSKRFIGSLVTAIDPDRNYSEHLETARTSGYFTPFVVIEWRVIGVAYPDATSGAPGE